MMNMGKLTLVQADTIKQTVLNEIVKFRMILST